MVDVVKLATNFLEPAVRLGLFSTLLRSLLGFDF